MKRRFYRCVQDYAAARGARIWGLFRAGWARENLGAAEVLAMHILDLPDDDPRFVTVAEAYTARGWGADRFPTKDLDGWLRSLGSSDVPNDPDELVTKWLDVERRSISRPGT